MILLDFDGTIVDVWQRYYQVFCFLMPEIKISFEQYKEIKRELEKDGELAKAYGTELPETYWRQKRSLLENKEYLKMDTLLCEKSKLMQFFEEHQCLIFTKRRNIENFYEQLIWLGLEDLKEKAIVILPDSIKKREWVRKNLDIGEQHIIVGDSDEEMQCADKNIKTYFVNTGLRKWDKLRYAGNAEQVGTIDKFIQKVR